MRLNEDVDPQMVGMKYRDCAKGAHMTPVARQHQCPTCRRVFACDGICEGENAPFPFERELICKKCPIRSPDASDKVTVRLTLDVDVSKASIEAYWAEYPDLHALGEDYKALLIREARAAWEFDGLVTAVRDTSTQPHSAW